MLPDKTVKTLKTIYGVLCNSGSLPYQRSESENTDKGLELVPPATVKYLHIKVVHFTTICQTIFVSVRFVQSYHAKNQKFFLMFVHFAWSCAFIMICWLHLTLFISRFDVLAYWNGLFRFYGNDFSMPGARMSAKWRRKIRKKPCLIDLLAAAFLIGAVLNTTFTVLVFLLNTQSYQFVYSTLPRCWIEEFPAIIVFCAIYEIAIIGINWTLLLFFVMIHLVHLLCTRDYLIMLRRNTQKGILKLDELRHHYRSIQILHNHYNGSIAAYMPLELLVVISLTFAGNIGTIRMLHTEGNTSIPELTILPMVSVLTVAFQIIFYQRAGDLHNLSSFYTKSSKKRLFREKTGKMYLTSFPPLCVKVGTLLDIHKFTVVRFVGGVVVGTARLSILFFRQKMETFHGPDQKEIITSGMLSFPNHNNILGSIICSI